MALTLINSNFSTLNGNLELLRQTKINQILIQDDYYDPNNSWNYLYESGSVVIDLWENGVKKYNHVVLIARGTSWGQTNVNIIYQESNDNINFFSDGVPLNINYNPSLSNWTFYLPLRNIASRYCRIYALTDVLLQMLKSIKSTL